MLRSPSARPAARALACAIVLLIASTAAPAVSVTYVHAHHADDVIGQSARAHDEANTFGTVTAALPGVGSSTSLVAGSDQILIFTAIQSRTDVDRPMVHTLFTASFTPSADTPFTFSAYYFVPGPTPAGNTYVGFSAGLADTTAATDLTTYDYYGRIDTPTLFDVPAPATSTLLAGHTYFVAFEAANETYPYFDGGTSAVAHVELRFVPEPSSAAAVVAMAILARVGRRRRAGRPNRM